MTLRLRDAALAALLLAASGADAWAIPRFAVRYGTTCATCHVNPSGGGMRNAYGRNVIAATRLPLRGSDGRAAPIIDTDLTSNLAFGSDVRAVALYDKLPSPQPTQFTFFLMQGDVYVAAAPSQALTFYVDLGFYGSNEAMAILRHPSGLYLKAGRFVPSFGLRLENHNVFTRQDIGFGPRSKDVGVEVGFQRGYFHLQAAALNGNGRLDQQLDENWQKALVARAELIRPGFVNLMAGASGWYNVTGTDIGATDTRAGDLRWGGFVGGSLGRVVYLAEADVAQTRKFGDYKWTRTYVSYQELDVLLARGLELNLNWEYEDPDLRYAGNHIQRGTVGFEVFPMPNVELKVFYRHVIGPPGNGLSGLHEAFAMLHVFL